MTFAFIVSLKFLFVNNSLQNHDLRHGFAWMILIVNNALLSERVFFAPENTLSGSDDIAGIEKISIAISESKGKRLFWAGLCHQPMIVEVFLI